MEEPRQLTSIIGVLLAEGVEFVKQSSEAKDRLQLPLLEETLKRRGR